MKATSQVPVLAQVAKGVFLVVVLSCAEDPQDVFQVPSPPCPTSSLKWPRRVRPSSPCVACVAWCLWEGGARVDQRGWPKSSLAHECARESPLPLGLPQKASARARATLPDSSGRAASARAEPPPGWPWRRRVRALQPAARVLRSLRARGVRARGRGVCTRGSSSAPSQFLARLRRIRAPRSYA